MTAAPDRRLHGLVIGGDQRVRRALSGLLTAPGDVVVDEAATVAAAREGLERERPDLVIVDLDRHDVAPWLEMLRGLRRACPDCRVAAVASTPALREAALAAGADAFVSKLDPADAIMALVAAAIGGSTAPGCPREPAARACRSPG